VQAATFLKCTGADRRPQGFYMFKLSLPATERFAAATIAQSRPAPTRVQPMEAGFAQCLVHAKRQLPPDDFVKALRRPRRFCHTARSVPHFLSNLHAAKEGKQCCG
jgi:hypothetical protein